MKSVLIVRPQTKKEDDEFGEDSLIAETAKAYACISVDKEILIHVMWVKNEAYRQGSGREFLSLIRDYFPFKQIVANGVDKFGKDEYATRARLFWLAMEQSGLINKIEWV